ncbi:MAG: Helicase associated domain protein [Bacilli bacterium]|nr:Helicase associated domain protein [Bacilli bacterium]
MNNEFEVLGLYEHNARAYKKVKEAFDNGEDVVGIVHATGTGKSYIALQLAYDNKDKKILYVAPSNSIIEHLKGIIEANPNLSLERDFPNLEFVTYQSFVNMSREEIEELNFEMMVLDEFHHIGAPIWGQRVEMLRKKHPTAKVFGMTAYTVRDRGTAYERDMANPDGNELFSNKIASTYDLCDAMLEGILPKPIYKSAYIRLMDMAEELEKKVKKLDSKTEEYRLYINIIEDAKKRIHQALNMSDLVKKHVKPDGKYIYFCPPGSIDGINDIEAIKKEALKWFKDYVPEENIVFYTSTNEMGLDGKKNRDAFYNDNTLDDQNAKGKLRIMFAINQYNEGVHAPNIDGVIMGRATESDIVYFEQLGRALSVRGDAKTKIEQYMKYSEEELIKICNRYEIPISDDLSKEEIIQRLIAPTVIDLTNNLEFLRQLENELKDRLKQAKKANREEKEEDKKIVLDDASFYLEIENIDIYEELRYVLDRLTMTWDDKYELAKAYYDTHGDLLIPQRFNTTNGIDKDINGNNLGQWITTQRQRYKNNSLSQDKIEKLEAIGMKWSVRLTPDDQWDRMYKLVKAYYETHGDLLIPQRFNTTNGIDKDINGNNLGKWINKQRQKYKNSSLSQDRIEKLEAIGMIWNILDYQWIKMYELAKAYYETYGNLLISKGFNTKNGINKDINSSDLGQWIIKQRQKYRKGSLSQDKIEKLELIGMVWNVRKNKSEINELCEQHGINQKNNKNIISHISFREFEAKINYLLDMKSPIYDDEGRLHEIFYMSNPDMEEKYGTNLEELINKYYHTRERK